MGSRSRGVPPLKCSPFPHRRGGGGERPRSQSLVPGLGAAPRPYGHPGRRRHGAADGRGCTPMPGPRARREVTRRQPPCGAFDPRVRRRGSSGDGGRCGRSRRSAEDACQERPPRRTPGGREGLRTRTGRAGLLPAPQGAVARTAPGRRKKTGGSPLVGRSILEYVTGGGSGDVGRCGRSRRWPAPNRTVHSEPAARHRRGPVSAAGSPGCGGCSCPRYRDCRGGPPSSRGAGPSRPGAPAPRPPRGRAGRPPRWR